MDNLAICLVTFASHPSRTENALRTIRSTSEYLDYPRENRKWFINDDGSTGGHLQSILDLLAELGEQVGFVNDKRLDWKGNERGPKDYRCGWGWNQALGNAHQYSDYVLWLEDDWELRRQPHGFCSPYDREKLPIGKYMKLLELRQDVGIVRFGVLAQPSIVQVQGYDVPGWGDGGTHWLSYVKDAGQFSFYGYSGNPHLRHARFTQAYGMFDDRMENPGRLEVNMDYRYRSMKGPLIWRPVMDFSVWGAWEHIGQHKTFSEE